MTDFQVRQWGIRRTRKSVVPLNQQAGSRRVVKLSHIDFENEKNVDLALCWLREVDVVGFCSVTGIG